MSNTKLKQMESLLSNVLASNNVVRGQAESVIEQHLENNRENCVTMLISLLHTSYSLQVRALCAVILRRRLTVGEPIMYCKLTRGLQQEVKKSLLHSIAQEAER